MFSGKLAEVLNVVSVQNELIFSEMFLFKGPVSQCKGMNHKIFSPQLRIERKLAYCKINFYARTSSRIENSRNGRTTKMGFLEVSTKTKNADFFVFNNAKRFYVMSKLAAE